LGKTARGGKRKISVARAVLMAFFVALFIKIFILDFRVAEGYSMTPAIHSGNFLVVCRVYYGIRLPGSRSYVVRWRLPSAGDVVLFYTPAGDIAVKRFARALPGEMFYALGDNASQSYDSRNYGPVPKDNIIGRVLGVR